MRSEEETEAKERRRSERERRTQNNAVEGGFLPPLFPLNRSAIQRQGVQKSSSSSLATSPSSSKQSPRASPLTAVLLKLPLSAVEEGKTQRMLLDGERGETRTGCRADRLGES